MYMQVRSLGLLVASSSVGFLNMHVASATQRLVKFVDIYDYSIYVVLVVAANALACALQK